MQNPQQKAIKTSIFSFIVNILFALVKGIAGILGNSYALIADAIESLTDVFSSLLVLLGLKYASRPADDNHPYGHGKAEPLITFAVVGFLLISATVIFYQSIINIRSATQETPKLYTLWILIVVIIAKETIFRFINKKSTETHSTALKADAWHHRSDAISSGATLIGIAVAVFMGKGFESADDWAALITSLFIAFNAYLIFRPALGEIMDEHSHEELEQQIREKSKEVQNVIDTEKVHIRKSGMLYFVDLHLIVDGKISVAEGHTIAHTLKDFLKKEFPQLANVLIHIEPNY